MTWKETKVPSSSAYFSGTFIIAAPKPHPITFIGLSLEKDAEVLLDADEPSHK